MLIRKSYRFPVQEELKIEIEDTITDLENSAADSNGTVVETRIQPAINEDEFTQPEGRILYRGSQLWKTLLDSEEKIDVLAKLRDDEGTLTLFFNACKKFVSWLILCNSQLTTTTNTKLVIIQYIPKKYVT